MSHVSTTSAATARSFFEVAAAALQKKGGRIHRHSYDVSSSKARPWTRPGDGSRQQWKAHRNALMLCLQEDIARQRREESGSPHQLLPVDVLILSTLLDHYNAGNGELFPEQKTIAKAIGYSRSWVNERLQCLRHHGYLSWVRRTVEKPGAKGSEGPQREQTSNAYYFDWRRAMSPRAWSRFRQLVAAALKKLGVIVGLAANAEPSPTPSPALAAVLANCEAAGDRAGWTGASQ